MSDMAVWAGFSISLDAADPDPRVSSGKQDRHPTCIAAQAGSEFSVVASSLAQEAWYAENIAASRWLGESDEQPS